MNEMPTISTTRNPIPPQAGLRIAKAEDVYLITDKKQRILDAAGGAIAASIGHGRKRVVDAMAKALREEGYVLPSLQHPRREQLSAELREHWLPQPLNQVYFTCGGSEGNDLAIRLALQYQQVLGHSRRTKILGREPSYHGTTLLTLAAGNHAARRRGLTASLPGHPKVPAPYMLRCPLGRHHPDAGDYYVELTQRAIDREGPETIAALIAEPITGTSGGALVPPDDYWPRIRQLCDRHGILLILDEVMTGIGRTGTEFACNHWQLVPDILIGSKGLGAGYGAISGVYLKSRIIEALQAEGLGIMFYTFAAQPAACAAATEVLGIIREEQLMKDVRMHGNRLGNGLAERFAQHPHVADVRGKGLLWAVEIVADRDSLQQFPEELDIAQKVVDAALQQGVLFYKGGTGEVRDIVCIGPPFTMTEEHLDYCIETLARAVDQVMANPRGFV